MVAIWQEKDTGFVIIDYVDERLFDGVSMRESIRKRAALDIPDQKVLCRLHQHTRYGQVPVGETDLATSAEWTKCQATVVEEPELLAILETRIARIQPFYTLCLFDNEEDARAWLAQQ